MKATKDFRGRSNDAGAEDSVKRAAKLDPIKKSGKERHALYSQIDEDEEDVELLSVRKRDSILDYFDDGQEDEDELEPEEEDELEEEDDEDEAWEDDEEEEEDK